MHMIEAQHLLLQATYTLHSHRVHAQKERSAARSDPEFCIRYAEESL